MTERHMQWLYLVMGKGMIFNTSSSTAQEDQKMNKVQGKDKKSKRIDSQPIGSLNIKLFDGLI